MLFDQFLMRHGNVQQKDPGPLGVFKTLKGQHHFVAHFHWKCVHFVACFHGNVHILLHVFMKMCSFLCTFPTENVLNRLGTAQNSIAYQGVHANLDQNIAIENGISRKPWKTRCFRCNHWLHLNPLKANGFLLVSG